jgi:hypothetical protein
LEQPAQLQNGILTALVEVRSVAKSKEPSFDFGYNVKPKKPKGGGKKQSKSTKQGFAIDRAKGGPLHGRSGS